MVTRVLWLTKGLGPGGAERLLVEIARRLDHDRLDVTAAYVLPWKDHLTADLEASGVTTVCLSQRDRDPAWPLRLRALMAGADVVHAHSPIPAVVARLAARTLPRRRRPLTISTEHNTWWSHHPATRWANRLTGGLDAATFAVTDEARESMSGAAGSRAELLVHGIDVDATAERPDAVRNTVRAALGISADEFVIGTVANLRAQKDYPNLLGAAARLVDRGVQFKVLAVGQGPLEVEIRQQRDDLALADHVELLGYRADAIDVMAACDVFVMASAWEGLPVAVMEALALGLPIVATAVGGMAEALDDTCAVLVPPRDAGALADAIASIIADPAQRVRLAHGARHAAARFDVARAVERLSDCYDELAARRKQMPDATDRTSNTTARIDTADHARSESAPAHRSSPAPAPTADGTTTVAPTGSRRRSPVRIASPSTSRSPAAGYQVRPMTAHDRVGVLALLGASLGWADDPRSRELFAWKHLDNPFGPSPGWVAVHPDDGIVGVRLFMRWRFRRGTTTVDSVRAVDTATHPDHQGRGLFTALTSTALDACRAEGVAFVFNTPNTQSRPGYLKMGWRDVGRLPLAVRPTSPLQLGSIARSRVPAERWSLPIEIGTGIDDWLATPSRHQLVHGAAVSPTDRRLRTDLDVDVLRWRYGLEPLHYRVVGDDDATVIVRLRRRGSGRELVVAEHMGELDRVDALAGRAARAINATHAIRLGPPDVRHGFAPLPRGGPILTWRALTDDGPPPLPNWYLRLGDVELF